MEALVREILDEMLKASFLYRDVDCYRVEHWARSLEKILIKNNENINATIREILSAVPGIQAYLFYNNDIICLINQFSDLNWELLIEAEDKILSALGEEYNVGVRAIQGRDSRDFSSEVEILNNVPLS